MATPKKKEFGMSIARRDFLKSIGVIGITAAAAIGTPKPKEAYAGVPDADTGTEAFWKSVGSEFNLIKSPGQSFPLHFNTGTTGSQPLFVQANLAEYNRIKSFDPNAWSTTTKYGFKSQTDRRGFIATNVMNCRFDEAVETYTTTDGMNQAVSALKFNSGDEIVTTNCLHPCGMGMVAYLRDRNNMTIKFLNLPVAPWPKTTTVADVVNLFTKAITPGKTKIVVYDHYSYRQGLNMPLTAINTAIKAIDPSILIMIDSAHGWGMTDMRFMSASNADFICGAGHKWQCGGPGMGLAYYRNQGSNLPLFYTATESGTPYFNTSGHSVRNYDVASVAMSRGETNAPGWMALEDSCEFWAAIGYNNVFNRCKALANYLRNKFRTEYGNTSIAVDPGVTDFEGGFVVVNPFSNQANASPTSTNLSTINSAMYTKYNCWGPVTRNTRRDASDPTVTSDQFIAERISTHAVYQNFEQIDYFFAKFNAEVDLTNQPQLPPTIS